MTQEKGALSYKYNDIEYGVAFGEIDINNTYCLAMSLIGRGSAYEIVE